MGYDGLRGKIELVDGAYVSNEFKEAHDLGRGPDGATFERPLTDYGHGIMGTDWEEGINYDRMRKERLKKAREALKKSGADALFCFRLENVRYLTGYRCHGFPMMFWGIASTVLVNDGKTAPLLYTMDVDHSRLRMPWVGKTTFLSPGGGLESTVGAEIWAKELIGHLKDLGIGKLSRIAVDSWSSGMFAGFPKAFKGVEFVDGQEIMLGARAIKTWDEIQCLKIGHLMTMAGVQAGLDVLKPGIKECEVRAEIFRAMDNFGSEGAQTTNCIVCSGGGTVPYRRFTSDKIIDFGDPVIIDMGACFNNYYGDMTRVYICGKNARPNKRLVEFHSKTYNALRLAEAAIKPGGTTYEPGEACTAKYIMGGLLGHGLGVAGVELPFLVAPSPAAKAGAMKIEPGMVFSIEPYYGEIGVGGIRLEDVMVVTDTGLEIISKFPFDERLIDENYLTF